MSKEAMKLALEALNSFPTRHLTPLISSARTAVREALAEQPAQQEPVAWRFTGIAGLKRYMTQTQYDAQTPETKKWYEPFNCANCTSPPAQQEPVAWGIVASNTGRICQVELDADEVEGHNPKHIVPLYTSSPAQRTWVGLTDKEKREARNAVSYSPLAMTMGEWTEAVQDATEAKLKEKNT